MNDGPIFIIDDDIDDREFLEEAWREVEFKNQLRFFKNAEDALECLTKESIVPFLIISDMSLPKMSGIELKKKLMETNEMHYKTVPFVFLTTVASKEQIESAYHECINGIFIKEASIEALKEQLIDIAKYWMRSKAPS